MSAVFPVFSILLKIFVWCPSGFSSFQVPQKLIQRHYALQGPFVTQRRACPVVESLPHQLIYFDYFSC
jgi:hypothetical protein